MLSHRKNETSQNGTIKIELKDSFMLLSEAYELKRCKHASNNFMTRINYYVK